jgi:hypothetical protein
MSLNKISRKKKTGSNPAAAYPIPIKLSLVKAGCQYCCNSISPTKLYIGIGTKGLTKEGPGSAGSIHHPYFPTIQDQYCRRDIDDGCC